MNTPHKHADVLRAIADGKAVQWQSDDGRIYWQDFCVNGIITPLTHSRHEWRIKPEPKPDVVAWLVQSLNGAWDEYQCYQNGGYPQIKIVRDGETGKLKSAEVLP